jgi:hypothetical protein
MGDVCKLMLSDDQHRLAVERMKRIRDRRLERQNPGIMSSAPTVAAISTRCRFIASVLQVGRIRAAPLPSFGQTAPKM